MDSVVIHGSLGQREVLSLQILVNPCKSSLKVSQILANPRCQGGTDTVTSILGAIYTVPKPITRNPAVSLPLIISGHGFCGYT